MPPMIEPKYSDLNTLFTARVFSIPEYQRYYSWGKKQRLDLFNDINQLKVNNDLSDDENNKHHFMATIVCFKTQTIERIDGAQYRLYDIVDGQQRITSLIILMKSIFLALDDGNAKDDLARTIVKADGQLILLQTNNTNQAIFTNFIRDGRLPNYTELETPADKNLSNGINECIGFVRNWSSDNPAFNNNNNERVLSLLEILRYRLGFVVYDTEDPSVVYRVFEVLNSRGLSVDWLDKCKSALMGKAYDLSPTPATRTSNINALNNLWGNLYTLIAPCSIDGQEIIRVTATILYGDESGKPQKAETALSMLIDQCSKAEDAIRVSNEIFNVARKLVELQTNIHLGPVADVLHARILAVSISLTDKLEARERENVLKEWEKVTFRIYGIFGKDSRHKVGDYVRLANKIMNSTSGAGSYLEILEAVQYLGSDYLIDAAIKEGIEGKNVYDNNQDVVRYILWEYEEYLAKELGDGSKINDQAKNAIWEARSASESIEHIYPQNPTSDGPWDGKISKEPEAEAAALINSIGNLILLPQALNKSASNSGFIAKKAAYRGAETLRMVKEITARDNWSDVEIKDREQKIINWMKKRWGQADKN